VCAPCMFWHLLGGVWSEPRYASAHLDAVQLEFGKALRRKDQIKRVAARVARALVNAGYTTMAQRPLVA